MSSEGPDRAGRAAIGSLLRAAGPALVGLVALSSIGCLASSQPGTAADPDRAAERPRRIEVCLQNDGRLPATIQLLRDGDPVGTPLQAEGFSRRCRWMSLMELVGTLDTVVDPVGPPGKHRPESLRDMLVTTDARGIVITLVEEGIELYGQSSYRILQR